jgi:hypothetical protein
MDLISMLCEDAMDSVIAPLMGGVRRRDRSWNWREGERLHLQIVENLIEN